MYPSTPAEPLLEVVAATELKALPSKRTLNCFTVANRSLYAYRDESLEHLLPAVQSETAPCTITTLYVTRDTSFVDWGMALIQRANHPILMNAALIAGAVSGETLLRKLGRLINAAGHSVTLSQVEKMIEIQACEGGTEMCTHKSNNEGRMNSCFFFTKNKGGGVTLGRAESSTGIQWVLYFSDCEDKNNSVLHWGWGSRLLICNLNPHIKSLMGDG